MTGERGRRREWLTSVCGLSDEELARRSIDFFHSLTATSVLSCGKLFRSICAMLPNHELLEIHRSKISLHQLKSGYSYSTIRLPYIFLKLVGCQRVYAVLGGKRVRLALSL
jgi:hypothetical protein